MIRLANDPSCPEYCHVLRTILTITNAKENSLQMLAENDPTLIEQFETILIQRREEILHLEDHQVNHFRLFSKENFQFSI